MKAGGRAACNGPSWRGLGFCGTLDASDLACFHARVQARDPHADCNRDGLTNLDDLLCFQTRLALGC